MATSNKTIAKNTLFLYFRMMLTMFVALYTSRIVLDVLGASDYGLYNVVGGVVAMMTFINGAVSSGTSRFITYELGLGDKERLRDVFNVALVNHVIIASIIFVLAETIGLWFVNTQMMFEEDRSVAVNVVYQLSILTTMLQVTQMPYTATIIAHEKMSIYAYISIFEVTLKLIMAWALVYMHHVDALIVYAIMLFLVQLIVMIVYRIYCFRKFPESHWRLVRKVEQYKEIFTFAGWDIVGAICVISQGQGVNILLNIYFGPVVNAARAVSYQVQGAFTQFTSNFMTAVNPEIVKNYARKEYTEMIKLINNASIYSYFLLLVFVMPVIFKIGCLLGLWLKEVPTQTGQFTIVILVTMMIRAIARPVIMGIHAIGDIKALNIYAGGLGLISLPIVWIAFHFGAPAIMAFGIILLWGILANIAEIVILKMKLPEFSMLEHLRAVYLRCLLVTIVAVIPCWYFSKLFGEGFIDFCCYYICAFLITVAIVYYTGLTKALRIQIVKKVKDATNKFI